MSNEHGKSCPMCALTKRIFGNKFAGCGDLANKPSTEAIDLIGKRLDEYQAKAKAQVESGQITREEYQQFIGLLSESYPHAAAQIPAMALLSGAKSDPIAMLQLVQANMQRAAEIVLEASGVPPQLLDMIRQAMGGAQAEAEAEAEPEEEEPVSLSSLN